MTNMSKQQSQSGSYLKIGILLILFFIVPIVYYYKIENDYLALLVLLTAVLFIVFGWLYKCENNITTIPQNDHCLIGQNKLYSGIFFGGCFDIWHLSHFLLWIIIGLLSPYHYWAAFGLSIGWEGYEHTKFKNNGSCTDFLCGRVEDVALNMGGYILGSYMRKIQK